MRIAHLLVALALAGAPAVPAAAQQPVTIRAASAFDGRGASIDRPVITVQGGRIVSIEPGRTGPVTYDLGDLTLMPGLIDTHVHLITARTAGTRRRRSTAS